MSTLLRHVSQEIALLEVVVGLLEQQAQALTNQEFLRLPDFTRRIAELAERLAACDEARAKLLVALGYSGDQAGGDAAAARGGPALQQCWARLLELAGRGRDLNHRNGAMVHAHLEFTRQSLAFLQTGARPLYGPDGQHRAGGKRTVRYAVG